MARRAMHPVDATHPAADAAARSPDAPRGGAGGRAARASGPPPDAPTARDARDRATRWERLLDAITDPVGVVSADNRLVYANAAYRALFDRVPDGVIGHECFSTHPNPSGGPCQTCPVPAAIRSRRPAFVESERPRPAAAAEAEDSVDAAAPRRVYQRWTYPVIEPDGSIDEVVEVIKDVTEQERLREEARQSEALRVADRVKAELLGTVSHELRSPLAAIKGYAGTLLRYDGRLPRAERHEFLTAITQASDRLEAIIDQLLLMSQLETGLITPSRAPVDLRQLAREAVTGIERRLPRPAPDELLGAGEGYDAAPRHHFVITDRTTGAGGSGWDAGASSLVMGDRRLLRQALDEVLDNAVKYSPDGGVIEVSLRRRRAAEAAGEGAMLDASGRQSGATSARQRPELAGAGAVLELCVRDEGLGIPNEHLGQIFDRFHRVEAGLTSAFGGLGLGLAICKRVIELHGGAVRVESEPGHGTEFCLLLPASAEPGGSVDRESREGRVGTAVSNADRRARTVALGEGG